MIKKKAIIISIAGTILTHREKDLLIKGKPWGIILFKRNILTFNQTKKLIYSIRATVKDSKFPILIDEEGGKVSRLSNFFDNSAYSQKFFGNLYNKNKKFSKSVYENYLYSMCSMLKVLGININTIPVMDTSLNNTNNFIGNRSYSADVRTIKFLGSLCEKIYRKNKIATVIKHIPGHGRTSSDSHLILPVIKDNYKKLLKSDFACFKGCKSLFAMSAHVLFTDIDSKEPATHSIKIINEVIRKKIGFKGILISDDISMRALKNDLITNAKKALSSGCNLVLHCSGVYGETHKLLKEMPYIDKFTLKKTSEFYNFLS